MVVKERKMFKIKYGEDGEEIFVSGSHLIWNPNDLVFMSVSDYSKTV